MPPPRPAWICASCARTTATTHTPRAAHPIRAFSAAPATHHAAPTPTSSPAEDLPRWQQTPPKMRMPFRLRPLPNQPRWEVNTRQEPVDAMYDVFLGRVGEGTDAAAAGEGGGATGATRGRDVLSEEVKWLALTHKSFDHGRRGFNDRLAYLGKRILDLQTSLALLRAPTVPSSTTSTTSNPSIFTHPALHGTDNLTPFAKHAVLAPARLAKLAQRYGMDKVVRWRPKKTGNLEGSGVETVLAQTVYSVIGAVALQRGGEVAARVAREKVLGPLGLR